MTVRIPKWLVVVMAVAIVGGAVAGAYLLGQSRGDDEDGSSRTATVEEERGSTVGTESEALQAPCDERAARKAALTSGFADRIEATGQVQAQMTGVDDSQAQGGLPPGPFWDEIPGYRVAILDCADLTGDGVEEMVLAPSAGAGGYIYNWAIFTPDEDGAWELAFSREAHRIVSLKPRDGTIVERAPIYEEGDGMCCPSSHETIEIGYSGDHFRVISPTLEPAQRRISFSTDGTPVRLGEIDLQSANPAAARAELGAPSSVISSEPEFCDQTWSQLGLKITFANLGGADSCGAQGAVGSFDLLGSAAQQAGWTTDDGAKLGMTGGELRQTYPEATRQGDEMTLIQRSSPIGEGGVTTSLSAYLGDGRALGYRIYVGAAGE